MIGQFDASEYSVGSAGATSGVGLPWWQGLLRTGEQIALNVTRPPAYQQTGPGGTVTIRSGGAVASPFGIGPTVVSPWLIAAGVGVLVLVLASSRRGQ